MSKMFHGPVGIVLSWLGYSTLPSIEELSIKGFDDGVVPSFTIICKGIRKLFFEGRLDILNFNLDKIGIFLLFINNSNETPSWWSSSSFQ